jgi:hypothetical protein
MIDKGCAEKEAIAKVREKERDCRPAASSQQISG